VNAVVFGVLVALLVPAALSWVPRLRTPMASLTALGLLGVLVGALALRVDVPGLRPWGAVVCVVLAAVGGGPLASEILARAKASAKTDAETELREEYASVEMVAMAMEALDHAQSAGPPPQLRGGKWIGVLERVGVAASLVCGWPEGIAIVLAVKGLGRYPELQAGTTERFIIGTFVSVLFAAGACGVLLLSH
jgi:F0F1-type ATP synthase membrane subunit c/vacuolar-type H+-ATPase subunit K